jgi:hypothetical protein
MPKKYSFNKSFFLSDSEQVFYWAGFIAADGCLRKRGNTYELSVCLAQKDKYHIEKFKHDIGANHPIIERIQRDCRAGFKDSAKAQISLYSMRFLGDLYRFNITPRKTKIYTFPDWLVNHELCHHFMRGYFDGDGCWSFMTSRKTPQLKFAVLGTIQFLKTYQSILLQKCNLSLTAICSVPGASKLSYGGNGNSVKIRDFLYKNATVFLQRKFDLVSNINIAINTRIKITPELLINKMLEFGSQNKIAKDIGYSKTHISRNVKKFDIVNQMMIAKANYVVVYG